MQWATEFNVQRRVVTAIEDCIASAGLGSELMILGELVSDDKRPDVWVLHQRKTEGAAPHLPVGVGEVKKPKEGTTGLDKPRLLGQIFDYMCMLRTQHGLRYVFGIITNYATWRIVWLPDTEAAAQATELPYHNVQPANSDTPLK
jgi:hypothetical protein